MSVLPSPICWNGERWYRPRSRWSRLLRWFVWVGGWDTFRSRPLRQRLRLTYLTPISVAGHRATLYGTGGRWWAQVRTPRGYIVFSRTKAYLSADGTPQGAHVWWWGEPAEVRASAGSR